MCVILIVLYTIRPTKILTDAYSKAELETRWAPAYFLIYDKSTDTECNRLIHILPFDWFVWAIDKKVFIIENTAGILCPIGTLPAIQVTEDPQTFVHACLTVTLDGLLSMYGEPHKIFYDVTDSTVPYKFTILDCLNILFRRYLTIEFGTETTRPIESLYMLKENSIKKYATESLKKFEFLSQSTLDALQERVYRSINTK